MSDIPPTTLLPTTRSRSAREPNQSIPSTQATATNEEPSQTSTDNDETIQEPPNNEDDNNESENEGDNLIDPAIFQQQMFHMMNLLTKSITR
jgi:hypothetical protein